MMIRYCRKVCLPILSLLCMATAYSGLSIVQAGTVPYAAVDSSQLRHDENSSSPGRQVFSRPGAVFDMLDPSPQIVGNADPDTDSPVSVDINTASVDELAAALPGIGPGKAQRIVDWREANGPFQFIDQLLEVSGIGPVTLANIRPFVRVGEVVSMQQDLRGQSTQEQAVIRALARVIRRVVNDRDEVLEAQRPL